MTLDLNMNRVRENVRRAETEDLLDRATVYRDGMEPAALEVIDAELRERGVGEADIATHRKRRSQTLVGTDGLAVRCGLRHCHRPAVARQWGWNRGWGYMSPFPWPQFFCEVHLPQRWQFRLSD